MQILGLDPLLIAVLLTAIGVALSISFGWLKGDNQINLRHLAASGIIAFFGSIHIVIATLGELPEGINHLALGTIVFGLIATVAGVDSLAKGGIQGALKIRKTKPSD